MCRSVAMKMIGHKTESVYRRYAIVDEAMLRDAAVKRAARCGQSPGQSGLVIIEPVSGKDVKKLVGRNGIEPRHQDFQIYPSGIAKEAMFAAASLRLSALE